MKNVVYFLLLLLELDNYLESYAEITEEVKLTFLNNNTKAFYDARNLPCFEHNAIDLTININDDRIADVKELDLLTFCYLLHEWKFTSPNTFKRFTNLINLTIYSRIYGVSDPSSKEKYSTQLFNVPTITYFSFKACAHSARNGTEAWVLPPNLVYLTIHHCVQNPINWKEMKKLEYLQINTNQDLKIPVLGYPSLRELDVSNTNYINVTIHELAPYCNLMKFSFNPNHTFTYAPCNCTLLKEWLKFLETEKNPLTVVTNDGDDFDDYPCDPCSKDFGDLLKEAKKLRVECLSLKPPEATTEAIVNRRQFDSKSWSFWIYIFGAFLIVMIIFYMLTRLAETISAPPWETPPQSAYEQEEEELVEG